ncbi:hypothetical protein P4O66_002724 [Electrophorus voltai]|uniref:Reverse transcriptase domain-containing protein n=1 Tax=Electrophorus voltai TaxID=2609070 RepID=A0AAD8YX76_9TELE|nr:hypothetical protein P4O66_002724 [Electrophorus voltai]
MLSPTSVDLELEDIKWYSSLKILYKQPSVLNGHVQFLKDFLESAEKHYMQGYHVHYYIFTDQPEAVPMVVGSSNFTFWSWSRGRSPGGWCTGSRSLEGGLCHGTAPPPQTHLFNWILDFPTSRVQVVEVGNSISIKLILSTGANKDCVISPILYSLFIDDCVAKHTSNIIFKFDDDTSILGLITNGDKLAYRDEVSALSKWCYDDNLHLNVGKTKEMIVDYRKRQMGGHSPLYINGAKEERVISVRFLGVHLTIDVSWSLHNITAVRSACQCVFFLGGLRKFDLPPDILTNFYGCTIESILTGCIADCKVLQRVVRTAESIIGNILPA